MTELVRYEAINELHRKARSSADTAVQYAVECGKQLIEAKKAVPHGEWKIWVDTHLDFNKDTAARYMRGAKASLTTLLDSSYLPKLWGNDSRVLSAGTGDEQSYTPPEYVESARQVMGGIDLDPASNPTAQKTVAAQKYYTADDDGLTKEWEGCVFLNPPYTVRVIDGFIEKLITDYGAGKVRDAVLLTNNSTDTSWFHRAAEKSSAVCFTKGRINFQKPDGSTSSPTNGQAFFYFGSKVQKFVDVFGKHGLVMVKA
jgi:phage N-6-adenine-methyltransferase